MDSYQKYLKYKSKYLTLVNMIGGFNTDKEINKNYPRFLLKLENDLTDERWTMPKNNIYYDIVNILNKDVSSTKIQQQKITKYYSHIINLIDPKDDKYRKLVFNLLLNDKINLDFLYYKFYYYLNIISIAELDINSINDKIKLLLKRLENRKNDMNKTNEDIIKLIDTKIEMRRRGDLIKLQKIDEQINDIYEDDTTYQYLNYDLDTFIFIQVLFEDKPKNIPTDNFINYTHTIFNINLLDFSNNNLFNYPLLNLNTIDRSTKTLKRNLLSYPNIISKQIFKKLNPIYEDLRIIKEKLLQLNIDNYTQVDETDNFGDLIPNQEDFNKYYEQIIANKPLDEQLPFNKLSNIDKILIVFNFKTRSFNKIKYLLFQYEGTNGNELYVNNNILIIKPKDMISSIFYATSTTKWCTAAKHNNLFSQYQNDNLHILVDLITGELRYQIGKYGAYRDIYDINVNIKDIYVQYPFLFKINNSSGILDTLVFIYYNDIQLYILTHHESTDTLRTKLELLADTNYKIHFINEIIQYDHHKRINFTNEDINIFDNTNKKKLLRQSITYKYNNLIFIIFKNNEYRNLIYTDMAKHIMEKIYDKDILNLFFDNILSNIELFKKKSNDSNDTTYHSLLLLSILNNNNYVFNLLLHQLTVEYYHVINMYSSSLLNNAIDKNNIIILKLLLNNQDIELVMHDNTALTKAINKRDTKYDIFKLLLNHSRIIEILNSQDKNGNTPLHLIINSNHNEEISELFINHDNININIQNKSGSTPLHIAVNKNKIKLVKALLKHKDIGLIIDSRDVDSNTPFDIANKNQNIEIIEFLS
jgi:ankyrin repeat protein